ncbi:MAG TPA: hypothetical protein PK511_05360 [Chitinophagales bacterium]|nr:hypothetical protein [Chitinophagales bacterium]HNA56609.1 hypothetical protein [Chitinophagales bacterium]HNE45395.1 hypothetical protein [Chitinophagales bacterium]HNF69217.1 hypothetical protein [Chitinophagales bacterium]HNI53927.1 hypothetical protein [Chitinophagales bacterium]
MIIFAVVLAIVLLILGMVSEFKPAMTFAWMCFGMFFALTLITYFFSAKTMERKFSSFMNVFFVGIFSKLILSAIMVLIFKVKNETTGLNYIVPFAIIYFTFLFFETVELVKLSRSIGNPPPQKPTK